MKQNLLTAFAVLLSLCGYAQTKGQNTIGFGINSLKQTSSTSSTVIGAENENRLTAFSLGYGVFVSDNNRLGFDVGFSKNVSEAFIVDDYKDESKTYQVSINYQHYYPLVGKLFAYAAGSLGYSNSKSESTRSTSNVKQNSYYVSGYGGLTWFVSKRFAFETQLLSASAGFNKIKTFENIQGQSDYHATTNSFNLSTNGLINNLGFKIYLTF